MTNKYKFCVVYVTVEQHAKLKKYAKKRGESMSSIVRRLIDKLK